MRYFLAIFGFILVAIVSLAGLRGTTFSLPPLFIFPDMEWQAKYKPQSENHFFSDDRDDRPVIAGTVVRGYGWAEKEVFSDGYIYAPAQNPPMFTGLKPATPGAADAAPAWFDGFPVHVTPDYLELGRQKFNINCAVCHGQTGDGNGITKVGYNLVTVRNLMEPYVANQPNGQIFSTITFGKGKMGAYGDRLSPAERWAVIAYVRTLEFAGNATPDDVPAQYKEKLGL